MSSNKLNNYNDISSDYNGRVPYHIQLNTKEWHDKRNKIIARDSNFCQQCNGQCVDLIEFNESYIFKEVDVIETIKIPYTNDIIELETSEIKMVKVTNPLFAHIHHKYYSGESLAWEYPDDALILLCHKCHSNFHRDNKVPYYENETMEDVLELTPCSRCYGAGHFAEYNHVENGICFRCRGARYEELINE